jgi:hypothetical protein
MTCQSLKVRDWVDRRHTGKAARLKLGTGMVTELTTGTS